MSRPETNRRKIVQRLEAEGWTRLDRDGPHDLYASPTPARPGETAVIPVPRHRELSPGVARSIARRAGWP
jgi:mRNA interferase HicA